MNNKRNTMRQLTDIEKKLITKNLKFIKDELEYKEKVELGKVQFILDSAEISVRKQIKDKEKEKKILLNDIKELEYTINELEIQLTKGVKIKK